MTKRTGRILPNLSNDPLPTSRSPVEDVCGRPMPTQDELDETQDFLDTLASVAAEEAATTDVPLGAHRHVEPRTIHSEPRKPWKRRLIP